jgi:N utilization substance protein B
MAAMTRRQAREAVFELLFETEFDGDRTPEQVLALAKEDRDLSEDTYVESTYLGAMAHRAVLDVLLSKFSHGWKTDRMSRVSRAVLRLGTYEMLYCKGIPTSVSLNEAVELTKKFDDPKARAFVNGVLNSIKNEIEATGAAIVIANCEAALAEAQVASEAQAEPETEPTQENE